MLKLTGFIVLLFILSSSLENGFCESIHSNVSCIESERKALLEFMGTLIDKSDRLSSWIGEDCCAWEGVGCNYSTGRVLKLDLRNQILFDEDRYFRDTNYSKNYSSNCLGGEINPSILNLEHLQYLDLSLNNFSGIQIPTFLGSLKNLRYLNLSSAGFEGRLPDNLGNLTSLEVLHLGNAPRGWDLILGYSQTLRANSLWWLARLISVIRLDLAGVFLADSQDWLHAINMLPSLFSLKLAGCELHNIPPLSHVNFTSLAYLDLHQNKFNSALPLWLSNLTALKRLHLRDNHFHGPIHDIFGQLTSLTMLHLSSNNFSTPLLNSLCNLTNLIYMDLSDNHFQGSLPLCVGKLTSLNLLNLGGNDFQGSIPTEIGLLRQLGELNLASNELNGTIPLSLWQLTKLEILDISHNFFSGLLSDIHFAKLTALRSLSISSTLLSLNLSSLWLPPFQLQYVAMDSIKVGPQFPPWLYTQQKLEALSMSNASISYSIPKWFENWSSHISHLDLSYNQITGKLPQLLENNRFEPRSIFLNSNQFQGPLKSFSRDTQKLDLSENLLAGHLPPLEETMDLSLQLLILNENRLSGNIPDYFCKIETLRILDLSKNQFTGKVPLCLGNLRHLNVLNLGSNSLSGRIPSSLSNLELLIFLHLNGNKFQGDLPVSLQNLKNLQVLDLGENELTGTIPNWIGEELSNLRILRLHSNNFLGEISLELCLLSNLQVLNLAQNNLTGFVPHCFNNFSAMVSIDPAYIFVPNIARYLEKVSNFMKGRELEYSSNLRYLKSIGLSENKLVGEIPEELMDLVGLQSLTLSKNHLSGRIPEKIGNLKQLESLDLSWNELSGSIPQSLSTINSLSYLNLSFNQLSGRIPTGDQLQTLPGQSSYLGNPGLCGYPLSKKCDNDKLSEGSGITLDSKGGEELDFSWCYAGLGPGFALGFLGVFGLLHFKKTWRYAYFHFLENLFSKILLEVALKTSKLQSRFQ